MGFAAKKRSRYTTVSVWFHWLSAFLIVIQIWTGFTFHDMARGPARDAMFDWHKLVGVTILLLAVARLLHRLVVPPPALPKKMPGWEKAAANVSHIALYALMIIIPYTGIAAVSARADGGMIDLKFGLQFPTLPGASLVGDIGSIHELLAKLLIGLLVLHVLAALYHQFGPTKIASGRMWPFKSKRV